MTAHLADLLSAAAVAAPDQAAMVEASTGRSVTWAELDSETDRVASGLTAMGLVAGYRVALALTNRLEFVTCYLGTLRAGLVAVPVNPRSATGELVRLLADCTARVVVADASTVTTVRAVAAGLTEALVEADPELRRTAAAPRLVVVGVSTLPGETAYDDLVSSPAVAAPTPADPERLAVLLYTSGTSGRPRAAMLSHRSLLANIEQSAAVRPPLLTSDDVVLGVLPLFHVYGLNAVLGLVLHERARLVLVDGFDMEDSLRLIEEYQVTVLPVAPPVFAYWQGARDLARRLSGVRLVISGSAPLSPQLVADFTARTGIEVNQGYGLTEAASVVTCTAAPSTRTPSRAPWGRHCRGSSCGWSPGTEGRARGGGRRGDLHSGRQPVRRLLAGRVRRARRRGLVRHRGRRLPGPRG